MPERQLLAKLPPVAARLLRVAHELSFVRDLDTVVATARSAARDLTCADGVTFVLRTGAGCYYADEDAIAPLWKGQTFPIDQCVAGWVMTHAVPVVIPDIYADSRVPHTVYRPTFVRSLALVPVGAAESIAAIGAYWAHPHHATEDEVDALGLLADNIALALENVRLYEDVAAALQREKEARLAAEAAMAAKDEFLALVAHELRQPLHASLAAVRMMAVRISRESGEHARSVVERQVTQMTRLVEDLVDAARIVRGQIALNATATDLGAVVTRAADTLRPLMEERRHVLTASVPKQPVVLHADAPRLEQVLTNLLTNAAKYTEPGGRIGIDLSTSGAHASVTVRDTGRGIDPTTIPRLFNLFTRGVSDVRGFGVGLAVSKRLVELHGGSISASSTGLGRGAEFQVSLPIAGPGQGP